MLLNTLQRVGQPPHDKNCSAPNVNSTHLDLSIFNITIFTRNFDLESFYPHRKYFCSNVKNFFFKLCVLPLVTRQTYQHYWGKKCRFFSVGNLKFDPLKKC